MGPTCMVTKHPDKLFLLYNIIIVIIEKTWIQIEI